MRRVVPSRSDWADGLIVAGGAAALWCALTAPSLFLAVSPPCLFTLLTGHHCWGCGMTHAIVAMLHGEPGLAIQYNGMVVVAFPLLCLAYLRVLCRVARKVAGCWGHAAV